MGLSSADIKRQILKSANESEIKKKVKERIVGISEGEQLEIGNELESVTRMKGWTIIESYLLRRMNLVGLALSEKEDPDGKGRARGYIELLQWIQLMIQNRDEILAKEKELHPPTERPME